MIPSGVRRFAVSFQEALNSIVVLIAKLFLIAMVIIVSYLVFMRYIMKLTPQWGHEVALGCMVWFSLLSATMATKEDRHITIRIMDLIAPPSFILGLRILAGVIIVGFLLFMILSGIPLARLGARIRMPGSGLRMSYIFAAVPVSGASMLLMFIARLIAGEDTEGVAEGVTNDE